MQTTSITSSRSFSEGPRVIERSRGTAHPAPASTRDRVMRSLLLRPDVPSARRAAFR